MDIEFLWVGGVGGVYSHFHVKPPTTLRLGLSWGCDNISGIEKPTKSLLTYLEPRQMDAYHDIIHLSWVLRVNSKIESKDHRNYHVLFGRY